MNRLGVVVLAAFAAGLLLGFVLLAPLGVNEAEAQAQPVYEIHDITGAHFEGFDLEVKNNFAEFSLPKGVYGSSIYTDPFGITTTTAVTGPVIVYYVNGAVIIPVPEPEFPLPPPPQD